MNIILWIITAILWSIWWAYRKKAIDNSNLSIALYTIFWPIFWFFLVYFLSIFWGIDIKIYKDYFYLWIILIISILGVFANYIDVYSFSKTKLSYLLPYKDFDKLIIILIWFFLYYWTKNSTSITSFFITLFTVFIILINSINFKNVKFDRIVVIYLIGKIFSAISVLLLWYVLIKYSTITYMSINIFFLLLIYLLIIFFKKDNIKNIFNQSKTFYKARTISLLTWWLWIILSFYIIESSWLLIATLISFISLVFNILSIKFILKDNPTKKQIILAIIISILIGLGYYFK